MTLSMELTDNRIHGSTDLANLVSEIEQSDGEPSKYDCEMQPGQECPFIGEEDLGFNPDWYGDPLQGPAVVSKKRHMIPVRQSDRERTYAGLTFCACR